MLDKIISKTIKTSRKHLRNSWVHKLPITSYVYKKLYLHTVKDKERQFTFLGIKIVAPTHDTTIVPSMIDQDYEVFELEIFKKLAEKSSVMFDIGANIGLYSLVVASIPNNKSKIFAFEPVAENRKYIDKNISLNKLENIEIVPMAVGEKPGKLKLYLAENSIGTHSAGRVTDKNITITKTSIDSFSKLRNVVPDIIKIDIEGYEAYALEGGLKTIKKHKPTILIEFDTGLIRNCGSDPAVLAETLLSVYRYCYLIDERKKSLVRINSPSELLNTSNVNLVLCEKPVNV